ncbi:MAG: DUF1684 domain-containing protein [Burkholderiales bacterium]
MSAQGSLIRTAFTLAHWRREVAELYAQARRPAADRRAQCESFRRGRDTLFRTHPQSPIAEDARAGWPGIPWFPYDPAARVEAAIVPAASPVTFDIALAHDGVLRCALAGEAHFVLYGNAARLALYWLEGYGGGIWLPFADATTGATTYGGGRYLYDTIKGADLGVEAATIVLDFNYAYHPSCAYDPRWSCPLTPAENRLPFAVAAGERLR